MVRVQSASDTRWLKCCLWFIWKRLRRIGLGRMGHMCTHRKWSHLRRRHAQQNPLMSRRRCSWCRAPLLRTAGQENIGTFWPFHQHDRQCWLLRKWWLFCCLSKYRHRFYGMVRVFQSNWKRNKVQKKLKFFKVIFLENCKKFVNFINFSGFLCSQNQ